MIKLFSDNLSVIFRNFKLHMIWNYIQIALVVIFIIFEEIAWKRTWRTSL